MDDFLTARQVQDLLKVDRITVYRMINDGRLSGIKIGQQWRFPQKEVENLLNGIRIPESAFELGDENNLPVHCLQTIQNLFSSVSEFPSVMINLHGIPITEMSRPSTYCRMICNTDEGQKMCQRSRRDFFQQAHSGVCRFTCQAGLHYAGTVISTGTEPVGLFLVGGFKREGIQFDLTNLPHMENGTETTTFLQELQTAYDAVPYLPFEQEEKLDSWATATAQAFESILKERSVFAQRLKQIADLTQIP